jgi:hypothetical protein
VCHVRMSKGLMCSCSRSCNPDCTPPPLVGGGGGNCTKCGADWCCSSARLSYADCFGTSQNDVHILLVGRYDILLTAAVAAPCKVAVRPHTRIPRSDLLTYIIAVLKLQA